MERAIYRGNVARGRELSVDDSMEHWVVKREAMEPKVCIKYARGFCGICYVML